MTITNRTEAKETTTEKKKNFNMINIGPQEKVEALDLKKILKKEEGHPAPIVR